MHGILNLYLSLRLEVTGPRYSLKNSLRVDVCVSWFSKLIYDDLTIKVLVPHTAVMVNLSFAITGCSAAVDFMDNFNSRAILFAATRY
jgi:hypothetical protein